MPYNSIKHIKLFIFTSYALVLFSVSINAQEVRVIDNKGTIQRVNNNNVFTSPTDPNDPTIITLENDVWFDTTNNQIKIYDTTDGWKLITSTTTQNIYTFDDTLTNNRTLTGDGNSLRFTDFSRFDIDNSGFININSTNGFLTLRARDGIDLQNSNVRVLENLFVAKSFVDSNNDVGTAGQILSSTVTGTDWIDPNLAEVVNKTTNYTLVLADNGKVFTFNSAADVTLTVPAGLPVGYNISIYQIGNGNVTITGAGGVTVLNRLSRFKTAGRDAGIGLIATATNVFHLTGDLKR